MASKIHTDNPKHHKYVITNKQERKKNIKNIIFNCFTKIYDTSVLVKDTLVSMSWYKPNRIKISLLVPNYHSGYKSIWKNGCHSEHIGERSCKILYDDCNHKTYRVIKNGKFIKYKYYGSKSKIFKR